MALGAIFAVLLILIALLVIKSLALDRESKAYADTAVKAIVSDWNEQALFDRASSDFMKVSTHEQVDSLFARLRVLGRMTRYADSKGSSSIFFNTTRKELTVTAVYLASANFEHGSAQIKITLVKRGGSWKILGFFVQGKPYPAGSAQSDAPIYCAVAPDFA